jgi:hypothetical protein
MKLVDWLMKDCPLEPGRPGNPITDNYDKCTPARTIIPNNPSWKGFMECVANQPGKVDKQHKGLMAALQVAVNKAGYFNTPDSFGLDPEAEYCGRVTVTKHLDTKNSEKQPIIITKMFWLTIEIDLKKCPDMEPIHKTFRLDLLQWIQEFKDAETKVGDKDPPDKIKRPPVISGGGGPKK